MPSTVAEILKMEVPLQAVSLRRSLSSTALVDGAVADLHRVERITEDFDTAVGAAEVDDHLSPKGKIDAVAKAARVGLAALDAFTAQTIGGLGERIAAVQASVLRDAAPSTDLAARVVRELRAQEIRATCRGLDEFERTLLYLGEPDPEVREAFENAPRLMVRPRPGDAPTFQDFVDPARVQDAVDARAEARNPEAASQLKDLRLIQRTYAGVVATARKGITEASPDAVPAGEFLAAEDPLAARSRLSSRA